MTTIAEGPEPRRQRGTGTVTRVREGVYRVRVGRGTTATGNPRYRTETVRGTRAEAEARAAVIYEEMGANERGMTLAAYYRRRFLPSKRGTTRANLNGYAKMWKHVPESWKLAELTAPARDEAQAWVDGMSPGTARSSYKYFRALLRAAFADELLPHKPCDYKIKYPEASGTEDGEEASGSSIAKVWDASETVAAWLLMRGQRLEAYLLVASATGMRREEALVLDWSDFEFKVSRRGILHEVTAWVSVEKAVTEEDGVKGTKNAHSCRRVPICGYAARRLYELRKLRGPVAPTLDGRRLGVSGFRRQWWNLWKGARMARYSRSPAMREFSAGPLAGKVADVSPNTLRHANITLMDEIHVEARTNRRYHGHRQSDVQGAHYIRRYDMQLLKAARAVAAAYDEAAEFAMTMILDWDIDTSIFE
ncbi:MAG: hypothetical protein IKF14_11560 [Atopobiaceae bacterium]|nr:hypothetical protein [Atopobiaceae bacterium]